MHSAGCAAGDAGPVRCDRPRLHRRAHGRLRRSEAGAAGYPGRGVGRGCGNFDCRHRALRRHDGAAKAMVVRVELGIQQGVNSTLNSYLEKLLIMLTGSFGRKGTNQLHSWLQPLWGNSPGQKFSPTGDEVIAGLLSPNIFPDAVLGDHPDRLRGVWIDSSNPANTASNTKAVERALQSLELCVVVDVAMTETARLAHYVLPASSQYEKTEFTLFNFEFPTNYFHVRAGVLPPLRGTLPEPEIYTRLARAMGFLPGDNVLAPLREAARRSRPEFAAAFRAFIGENPSVAAVAPLVLYHTLGQTLPDG